MPATRWPKAQEQGHGTGEPHKKATLKRNQRQQSGYPPEGCVSIREDPGTLHKLKYSKCGVASRP